MKKEKLAYAAPTTDILELRVENRIMDASPLDYSLFSDPNADVEDQSNEDWWNN